MKQEPPRAPLLVVMLCTQHVYEKCFFPPRSPFQLLSICLFPSLTASREEPKTYSSLRQRLPSCYVLHAKVVYRCLTAIYS